MNQLPDSVFHWHLFCNAELQCMLSTQPMGTETVCNCVGHIEIRQEGGSQHNDCSLLEQKLTDFVF